MTHSLSRKFLPVPVLCLTLISAFPSAPDIFERYRDVDGPPTLKVDLSRRELRVVEDGKVVRTYGVAVGTRKHPTPTGSFQTGRIVWNPRWVPPPSEWARRLKARAGGDPRNPMQGVKIYFREPWFFIHGTNNPASIGTAASHGCLRMRTKDAKALARRISKHGSVQLIIEQ